MGPYTHVIEHDIALQRDLIARLGLQMDQDTHGIEHDIDIPREMIVRLGLQIFTWILM